MYLNLIYIYGIYIGPERIYLLNKLFIFIEGSKQLHKSKHAFVRHLNDFMLQYTANKLREFFLLFSLIFGSMTILYANSII